MTLRTSLYIADRRQKGAAALIFVLLVFLTGMTVMMTKMSAQNFKTQRELKTSSALAEAKAALLAYATTVNLVATGCGSSCRRPGDLPCPDLDNDGEQETICGNAAGTTGQVNRLGRLPWKSLGISDLRDGDGERLWYAVSSRYKQNTRWFPLNSETLGTISLRNADGSLAFDGAGSTGLVAVIFSVGTPIARQDGLSQDRSAANINNPSHYLDVAMGEDNADFVDGTSNGFIRSPVLGVNGDVISNDKVLEITQDEFSTAIAARVASQVQNALLDYYCGNGNANYATKSCLAAGGNRFYPSPAKFNDLTCLGVANASPCESDDTVSGGRVPATPTLFWTSSSAMWGTSNNHWFQQNGWRELVYYARANACMLGTNNCTGSGFLTLNGSQKNVVTIVSGRAFSTQPRANNKLSEANYLELGNASPLDDQYIKAQRSTQINDYVMSIP